MSKKVDSTLGFFNKYGKFSVKLRRKVFDWALNLDYRWQLDFNKNV